MRCRTGADGAVHSLEGEHILAIADDLVTHRPIRQNEFVHAAQKAGLMDHETAWDEGYREGREAGYNKGLDEGREEQKQQLINHRVNGLADALVFMLMSRFGEISVDIADRIYGALEEELYIWLAAVPQANTLQEVLACRPHEDMMVLQLLQSSPALANPFNR